MFDENDAVNWENIQCKILERKGLTFITQFIMLKPDTSLFEAINKHKKNINKMDKNFKGKTAGIRHMQKQVKRQIL